MIAKTSTGSHDDCENLSDEITDQALRPNKADWNKEHLGEQESAEYDIYEEDDGDHSQGRTVVVLEVSAPQNETCQLDSQEE